MSTHSSIAIKNKNGTITSIYCHFDGMIEHNGQILLDHYNTEEKVQELIDLGDLSYLAERTSPNKNEEHSYDGKRANGVVLAYHRDRGENWNQSYHGTEKSFLRTSIIHYLWKDGKWFFGTDPTELNQELIDSYK